MMLRSWVMLVASRNRQGWLSRFAVLLLVLFTPFAAFAQFNTGEIGGLVRDSSGAVLPGAVVTATHPDSGTVVERVADSEGRYFLPALRIGRWEITAGLSGFATQKQTLVI